VFKEVSDVEAASVGGLFHIWVKGCPGGDAASLFAHLATRVVSHAGLTRVSMR
jgi:hypothetical protein